MQDEKSMSFAAAVRGAACAASLVVASPAVAEIEFDAGADLRIRQELMKNIPGLPGGGVVSQSPRGVFTDHVRFRPRVWGEISALSEDIGEWRVYTRLADEFRWCPEPYKNAQTFPGEVIIDNLFLEGKGVFDGFLDLRIGRQNLYGYCGLDHIFVDGTPGDGSRTCYSDMAAFTLHFTEDSKLDLFALYDVDDCDVRWGTERSRHTHLAGLGRGGDRDDWGYGAIWSSKLSDNLPYQIFAMEKGSTSFWVDDVKYPWTRRALLGAKAKPLWPVLSKCFEAAYDHLAEDQVGEIVEDFCDLFYEDHLHREYEDREADDRLEYHLEFARHHFHSWNEQDPDKQGK